MDTVSWRPPTQGASGAMEFGDWKAQLQRQRTVNKIKNGLKRHLPSYGDERLPELKKIAESIEEEIYTVATSQSEYSRKICFKMLTTETRLQNSKLDSTQSNSSAVYKSVNPSVPLDLTSQTHNPNGGDWQEDVYQEDVIGIVGDTTMESDYWRAQLQPDTRQRIVHKIMDTLKKHLPFSGPDGLHELMKIATRFEENIFNGAISQSDYLRKISLKLLTIETDSQVPMSNVKQSNSIVYNVNPLDPGTSQNLQPAVQRSKLIMNYQEFILRQQRQEQLQPSMQILLKQTQQDPMGQQTNFANIQRNQLIQQQLIGQHQNLSSIQQHSGQQQQLLEYQSGSTSMDANQLSVQQMLQSNKMPIQQQNQQGSASWFPTRVQQPQLQQQMFMQQRLPTASGFQQQNMINQQKQLYPHQSTMPEASSSRAALTGNPNGGDWKEELYQEIKAMKDLYLLDLNDLHQKILSKLQQHDSLPQQPKNEQLEKLKVFKNMLERFMQLLQIPKHGISANYKDKLGTYEKQIINVINSNRRKPAPPQQQAQALPPQNMQSLQQSQQTHSRMTPVQSNDQMNLQGSMSSMQPNNMMCNLQQTNVSLSVGSNAQRLSTTGGLQLQNVIHQQKHLFQQQSAIPSASSSSLAPVAQTGNPNGGGWQEEVYKEIKAENDMYLLDSMPTQGVSGTIGDPTMEYGDWRAQMHADSRQRIVNKMMDILKRLLPFSGHEGLQELMKIAVRFEERIYDAATSESDYLRKISLKMLTVETRSPNPMVHTPQI